VRQRIDLVRKSLPAQGQLTLLCCRGNGPTALFFGCAPSTRRAAQPVSNRECRTTADTSGECATCRGKEGKLRFICRRRAFGVGNAECYQKIFAERLPAVADPKARQTIRQCEIVGLVGYSLGGLPGERLLKRLGIKSSDDTVFAARRNARPRSKPTGSTSVER
jgi:hypothetical protein